jgi:uncharacterized protein YkwD
MRPAARLPRVSAAVVALIALAACSDAPSGPEATSVPSLAKGGNKPAPSPTPAPTPSPTPEPTPGTTVTGCTGTTVELTADEKRSLDLHNQQRAANGLVQFCVHPTLLAAARAHSQEMIDKDYFSHNSYDGETFSARLVRFGYTPWRALAENIAWGTGTLGGPDAIFDRWMNSSGHRANILNGNLREIGIGVAAGTYLSYGDTRMWTADFGTR